MSLEKIFKLNNNNSKIFLVYRYKIFEHLKILHLWKYVESRIESNSTIKEEKRNDDYRIVLRYIVKKELYNNIYNCVIVKKIWEIIIANNKLTKLSDLINILRKFEIIKFNNYKNVRKFKTIFRVIIKELTLYFENIKINKNYYIYKYIYKYLNTLSKIWWCNCTTLFESIYLH